MPTPTSRPWTPYVLTFLLALLAGVCVGYWVLSTIGVARQAAQTAVVDFKSAEPDAKDLVRALGGTPVSSPSAPVVPSTQYQLLGVVAGPVGKGHALLVVGNAAPKAYTVGSALGDGLVLQSVSARGAKIGTSMQGPTTVELALPKSHGW